jgi:DNA-binding transcriptional ArsR family regulator
MEPQTKESRADTAADLLFKALADPGRRHLLDRMRVRGGLALNDLCEDMPMSRQAVTKHLLQLEEANLVVVHWKGREKLHYLNPVPIHSIAKRWIKPFEHPRLDALWNLKRQLED